MTSVISHPAKQDGFWRGCTISERRRSPTANPKAKPFSICFCNSSHYNFSTEAQPFRNASFCKIIHPQQILMARWTIFFFCCYQTCVPNDHVIPVNVLPSLWMMMIMMGFMYFLVLSCLSPLTLQLFIINYYELQQKLLWYFLSSWFIGGWVRLMFNCYVKLLIF